MTEQELRESTAPTPTSIEELSAYIESLRTQKHDYGTRVYAMSLSATAAFNYIASSLGVTGFQASCADLDIVRRTRKLKGPFAIVKADDMLYPQYDFLNKSRALAEEWRPWAAEQAAKKIEEYKDDPDLMSPTVFAHWQWLASQK